MFCNCQLENRKQITSEMSLGLLLVAALGASPAKAYLEINLAILSYAGSKADPRQGGGRCRSKDWGEGSAAVRADLQPRASEKKTFQILSNASGQKPIKVFM